MPTTSSRLHHYGWGRLSSCALAVVTLASLTAACGGSTKVVSAPSTTSTSVKGQAAFVSCMEKKGIPASAATAFGGRGGRGGAPGSGSAAGGRGTPPSLPAGVTQAQLRAARQACRSLLPAGSGFGGGNRVTSPAAAAYRNCLQLHGVTLPAPGSRATSTTAAGSSTTAATPSTRPGNSGAGNSGASNGGRGFGGLDTSNPTVQAALAACASLRPVPGGTTTTSTTSTSS